MVTGQSRIEKRCFQEKRMELVRHEQSFLDTLAVLDDYVHFYLLNAINIDD